MILDATKTSKSSSSHPVFRFPPVPGKNERHPVAQGCQTGFARPIAHRPPQIPGESLALNRVKCDSMLWNALLGVFAQPVN
jgi:hypothetical protein